MCDNLKKNLADLYSVGIENKEKIFAEDQKEELQEDIVASAASNDQSEDIIDEIKYRIPSF